MRHAIIDASNNVVNTCELLPGSAWTPPAGCTVVAGPNADIGDTWNGTTFVKPVTPEPPASLSTYSSAVQSHVDGVARVRGYLDGSTCASYAASTIPAWAADAAAFIAWRDSVWVYALGQLQSYETGQIQPPSVADLIALLPQISWPA